MRSDNSVQSPHQADSSSFFYGDSRTLRRVFTWAEAAVLAGMASGIAIVLSNHDLLYAAIIAASIPLAVVALVLARRGRFAASTVLMALTLFASLTTLATKGQGIHHLSNIGLAAVMIIVSMVARKRTVVALTVLAIGCAAWMVFGELAGLYVPQPLVHSVPGDFFSVAVIIIITAVVARVLTESVFSNNMKLQHELRERASAEEALRASELRYRTLFEEATEGIVLVDEETGSVVDCNHAFEEMSGYRREELRGRSQSVLYPADQGRDTTSASRRVTKEGPVGDDVLLTRDGRHLRVEIKASQIKTEGRPLVQAFFRDVSERERLQAELLQALKMESVGRLAGGVAHDFNNMLSVIMGQTEVALDEGDVSQNVRGALVEIRRAVGRSADLTRQLLAFARRQTVTPVIIDLNETVERMLKMLRRLIGEEITLAWMPGMDVWPVLMDRSQVDQILANLCINARDAIGGVGNVEIATRNVTIPEPRRQEKPDCVPGDYVAVRVSDNGSGMTPEVRQRIFEPFFTTKKEGSGTGLGLSTVYGIVTQNHGFLEVTSEPGRGTTFTIHLPRYLGAHALPEDAAPAGPARGSETILLVEDDAAVLDTGREMLKRLGYRVLAARTPWEALKLAEEHRGEVQLLLTDVIMPEMNGRELSIEVEKRDPKVKCLFSSGYPADTIGRNGLLGEGVHFIQKPFSMDELARKLRQLLD